MRAVSRSTTSALLARLRPLPYSRRNGESARWALAAGQDELHLVLGELTGGDFYRRGLALHLAAVSKHRPTVTRMLADPDRRLRASAAHGAARTGLLDSAAVTAMITDAAAADRALCYRLLRAGRHQALADEVVRQVLRDYGDREAAALLPACGEAVVVELLPRLRHAVSWTAMVHRHPAAVLADLATQLRALGPAQRTPWWGPHAGPVLAAAQYLPHRVLDLLQEYGPTGSLPGVLRRYGPLLAADPDRVLALLAAPQRAGWLASVELPRAVLKRLGRLEPAALIPLARSVRDNEQQLNVTCRHSNG